MNLAGQAQNGFKTKLPIYICSSEVLFIISLVFEYISLYPPSSNIILF